MSNIPSDMFVKQIDPTVDFGRNVKVVLQESGASVNPQRYSAATKSASSVQFNNIDPPSAETVVDRKVLVTFPMRLTLTGTNVPPGEFLLSSSSLDGTGELAGGVDGLRAFPIAQMTQSMNVNINGHTFNQNLNEYIIPLLRYSNFRDVGEQNWSTSPSMMDTYQQYSDFQKYGSARNVLANAGENGYRTPRGGFPLLNIVSQGIQGNPGAPSTSLIDQMYSTVDVQVSEYIMISPLDFGKELTRGLVGVSNFSVTFNIDSNYGKKIWSHDAVSSGKTINSVLLSFDGVSSPGYLTAPQICFRYITPKVNQILPLTNMYAYHNIISHPKDFGFSIAPGASATYTSDNIQLNSVPKRLYFFVRRTENSKTINDTDSYGRITRMELTFGNQASLLSQASEEQLYEMSVKNGLKASWWDWTKGFSSVLCVDFSQDVSLHPDQVVGQGGQFQVRVNLNVMNISSSPAEYTLSIVELSDGFMRIDGQSVDANMNLGRVSGLYDSPEIQTIDYDRYEDFFGSGLGDRLRKYIKSPEAKALAKKGLDYAESAIKKYGPSAANYAISHIPGVGSELGAIAEAALRALSSGEITQKQYESKMNKILKQYGRGVVGGGVIGGREMDRRAIGSTLARY